MKDHDKVISLRKQGRSYNQIAGVVNISCTTAQLWVKTTRKPRFLYATRRQQRQLNSRARKLSQELAYIYGVLIGDGYLDMAEYSSRISLQVVDKEFATKFYHVLKKWSGFKPTWRESIRIHNHKTKYGSLIKDKSFYYTVRLGSKQAVKFLASKVKCKTKQWAVPKDIKESNNKRIISSFLKGLYDSEGFPVLNVKNNNKRIEIEMWGIQLRQVQTLLKKLNIESTFIRGKKGDGRGTYVIRIIKKESIKSFAEKIGFTIERKKRKLQEILSSYK
jgi:hypothetical protein